jgi:hypothetical protein
MAYVVVNPTTIYHVHWEPQEWLETFTELYNSYENIACKFNSISLYLIKNVISRLWEWFSNSLQDISDLCKILFAKAMICQQRLSLSDMLSMLKHKTCDCIVYILYNVNIYWNWWYKLYFWSLKKTIILWVIDINPISILIVYPYNCSSSINSSDYTFLTFHCLYIRTIHVHAVVIAPRYNWNTANVGIKHKSIISLRVLNVSVEANLWRLFYVATWDIKVWLKVGSSSCARRNKLEIKIKIQYIVIFLWQSKLRS